MRMWRVVVGLGAAVVLSGVIVVRLAVGPSFGQDRQADAAKGGEDAEPGFAVVELFTSEGCSSCPPADALLAEQVRDAREHGRPVYCLAFQVDYWNRLGWADPYSDAGFSRRQNDYAQAFQSDRVYTPQVVVNGTEEFVGSDRAQVAEKRRRRTEATGQGAGEAERREEGCRLHRSHLRGLVRPGGCRHERRGGRAQDWSAKSVEARTAGGRCGTRTSSAPSRRFASTNPARRPSS